MSAGTRRRPAAGGAFCALFIGLAVPLLAASARPNVEGPLPAHTGGFGEPTCAECHMGDGVAGSATILLAGLPPAWEPGGTYRFDVILRAESLRRGGFQLSARFAEGAAAGSQAGTLAVGDGRGRTTTHTTGVSYAHHSYEGSAATAAGEARWALTWTAPAHAAGPVVLHVAANAANDDNSEFGDRIVTTAVTLPPAQ